MVRFLLRGWRTGGDADGGLGCPCLKAGRRFGRRRPATPPAPAHAQQAQRVGIEGLRLGDAAAIVPDFEDNPPIGLPQADPDPAGAGVADDIGEAFPGRCGTTLC